MTLSEKTAYLKGLADGMKISTENDGLFDPSAYVNEEVFDFERIELGSELEKACKTYQFTFMSDGYRINGYISIPIASIESQKPTKCLVYCRGGNSRYGTLDDRATALRCYYSGRVVVGCELRGCNGTEGVEQFGGDDLNDVVKLIDLCDKRFDFIDMDDLCVEGESRGGMMTYMTARRDAKGDRQCIGLMRSTYRSLSFTAKWTSRYHSVMPSRCMRSSRIIITAL